MAVTITKGATLPTFLADRSAGAPAAAAGSPSGSAARLSAQVSLAHPTEAAVSHARPRGTPPEGAIREHSEAKQTAEGVAEQIRTDEEGSTSAHTAPLLADEPDGVLI